MPRERFWLCRLYVCLSVLLAVVLGWTDPDSQHYINGLNYETLNGRAASVSLAFCAIWGVLDTIFHDLLKARACIFTQIRRFRYLWLMGLVIGLTALIHQNLVSGYVMPVILRYGLDAMFALFIACRDPWTHRQ
jgi:hypothetical protein